VTANIAAAMLERLGPEAAPALPAFREAILKRDPAVVGAIKALGAIGAPAMPLLIEILENGDLAAKWEAASILGSLGEPARPALPALRKLAKNSSSGYAAKKAIRKIG